MRPILSLQIALAIIDTNVGRVCIHAFMNTNLSKIAKVIIIQLYLHYFNHNNRSKLN